MSYKIAIGSSDKINVDLKFGEVSKFLIYEVDEDIKLIEERIVTEEKTSNSEKTYSQLNDKKTCGNQGQGRGSQGQGCSGQGHGCGASNEDISRVALISDCRCVVCKKIGVQAQRQFEKKAISVFDVECSVAKAIEKISFYYKKIDSHETFRKA